jgi:hypothetical protein
MKILIEEQYYPADLARDLCGDLGEPNKDGNLKVSRVGYFFNHKVSDCVICLPKVVMFKEAGVHKAFGKYDPQEIVNAFSSDTEDEKNKCKLDERAQAFIKDFALWSYRTISTYARLNPESEIVYQSGSAKSEDSTQGTLLDVILMLIKFYNENKDYFMYVIKNIHSGYDRVNWRKTISRKTPIIQDGSPIYMEVINRRKQINFDEELMIIFYSILNYVAKHLGFDLRFECNYDLITGAEFESYMEEVGLIKLRAIKYKYFSDKDLQMWNLCYAFFEKTSRINSSEHSEDYLFVTDFDRVFESMMNALISDKDVPTKLLNQKDGKLVDHIFCHKSPIDGKDIYYIGDSKYYKTEQEVHDTSLYKQFTYAKNVIQFHFDPSTKAEEKKVTYRDEVPEGYAFTPNFFIGAYIPDELSYEKNNIGQRGWKREHSLLTHFDNRLFDRDTLWLRHYDVNLLYIMSLYSRDDACEQHMFKESFKCMIEEGFKTMLKSEYSFYTITVPGKINEFIKQNFYYLNGRVRLHHKYEGKLLMALEGESMDEKIPDEEFTMREFLESKHAQIEPFML